MVVARLYGAQAYGIYAFVSACIAVLAIPAAGGFDRLMLRDAAVLRGQDQLPKLRGLLRLSTRLSLAISVGVALLVAVTSLLLDRTHPQIAAGLRIGSLALPLVAYARIRQAAIQGLGRVVVGQIPETLVQPIALLLLLVLPASLTLVGDSIPVLAYIAAVGIACVAGVAILRRVLPSGDAAASAQPGSMEMLIRGLPFVWMLGMNTLLTYADVIVLGLLSEPSSAGIYRVASNAAMLVAFPLTAVNMAAAPQIARLFAQDDHAGLQRVATRAARQVLAASICVAVALTIFGRELLGLFGAPFVNAYPALAILSVAYVINAAAGTSGYLLIMTRHEKAAALCFAIAGVLNVVGNLILIPYWGVTGAAVATAFSLAVLSAGLALTVRRKMGLHPTAFSKAAID